MVFISEKESSFYLSILQGGKEGGGIVILQFCKNTQMNWGDCIAPTRYQMEFANAVASMHGKELMILLAIKPAL